MKSSSMVAQNLIWLFDELVALFTVNFLIRAAETYICKVSVSRLGVQMHFDGIALLPTPTITLQFAADKSKLSQALSQSFQEIQVQTYPMYLCIHLTINMLTREFSISHVGWHVLAHLAYSPDPAPTDYHLFLSLSKRLQEEQLDYGK
ncbi:unnamed protein product [Heligmosomoides polygyrus]|uniref:Autophagy-related protein 9 n=1 Tax=Heligmosomoides polygyrus TaxID=6339 RepID=A0A183GMR9_HELPZ|nr:unnamed protein product [Heligmosomoides polygyrus]